MTTCLVMMKNRSRPMFLPFSLIIALSCLSNVVVVIISSDESDEESGNQIQCMYLH